MDSESFITKQQCEVKDLQRKIVQLQKEVASCRKLLPAPQKQSVELILQNSNAVLFRRLAAEDPKKRRMVYVSPNISRFGYDAKDFMNGKAMFRDLVYHEDSARTLREIQQFTEQGDDEYNQFYRIVTKQGEIRWVEDRTSVYVEETSGLRYHQGIVIDIHDRKVIEEKLKKSEEKHRRVIETSPEGFLLLDNDCLIEDLNPAYERMVGLSRNKLLNRKPIEITPDLAIYLSNIEQDHGQQELEGILTNINGQQTPVLLHLGSLASDNGKPLGAAAFITDISSHKKALLLAAEVQQGLLPLSSPSVPGVDIAGVSIPCDEVGGDFYDYLSGPRSTGDITVVIGDISGHGVDAALLMSSARSYLKACFSQSSSSEEIIQSVNCHLVEDMSNSGRFMTLFYLAIRVESQSLEWIRAGHDPAILYDPISDKFSELKGPGTAMGIDLSISYHAQYMDGLVQGQIIILGTDGIWEAVNDRGEMFGKMRLKNIIRKYQKDDSEQILKGVISDHNTFTSGTIAADDLTIIIIKMK